VFHAGARAWGVTQKGDQEHKVDLKKTGWHKSLTTYFSPHGHQFHREVLFYHYNY
jgi:hypothetical protein